MIVFVDWFQGEREWFIRPGEVWEGDKARA